MNLVKRFTKTVLTLNVIWVMSRGFDMIIGIIVRMTLVQVIVPDSESKIVYDFMREVSFDVLHSSHWFIF